MPVEDHGETTRREFLKVSGAVAIGLVGAAALSLPIRKARATAPVWTTIPDQAWAIGVPVYLDLAAYCTDPDGDMLLFELNRSLPAGVALNGGVISGTPVSVYPATQFIATADDGQGQPPAAGRNLIASPNPSKGALRFIGDTESTGSLGTLRIFAVSGRLVYEREFQVAGNHYEVAWDGRTADGNRLPSGVYMASVTFGSETTRTQLVLAE